MSIAEFDEIERLETKVTELEKLLADSVRKGEELCRNYGPALIEIHDLKKQVHNIDPEIAKMVQKLSQDKIKIAKNYLRGLVHGDRTS